MIYLAALITLTAYFGFRTKKANVSLLLPGRAGDF
jgi:hypothetical protein